MPKVLQLSQRPVPLKVKRSDLRHHVGVPEGAWVVVSSALSYRGTAFYGVGCLSDVLALRYPIDDADVDLGSGDRVRSPQLGSHSMYDAAAARFSGRGRCGVPRRIADRLCQQMLPHTRTVSPGVRRALPAVIGIPVRPGA